MEGLKHSGGCRAADSRERVVSDRRLTPTMTGCPTASLRHLKCRHHDTGMLHTTRRPLDTIYLVTIVMLLAGVTQGADVYCGFHDNEASCDYVIASQYRSHIWAQINLCSTPVDVTFTVEMANGSWKWAHTFVNRDEIQPLPGLKEDINLRVALETAARGRLHIRATFSVAGLSNDVFMDDTVLVDASTACKAVGNANAYLPLVIFIILLVLIATLVAMFFGVRRHRTHRRHGGLLANMETPSAIYQDDPATISSTVIKNNIYRDSIILENDTDLLNVDANLQSSSSGSDSAEGRVRPPPPSGGRRKRLLMNGLPQPLLERLPEEPSEDEVTSQSGVNPSVTCT